MSASIGLVVLDLNQRETTYRCLQSITDGEVLPEMIVLVENGDSGLSQTQLTTLREELNLVVLQPSSNLGCAGGRNLGLNFLYENTDIERFATLDNDIVVPPDFVSKLKEQEMDELDLLAPVIMNFHDDSVWSSGGTIDLDGEITQLEEDPASTEGRIEVDWSPGACLIMHRSGWNQVGEFDEWIDFLYEDLEWCHRIRELGGSVQVCPDLRLEHEAHGSLGGEWSPTRVRFWARNGTFFRLHTLGFDLAPAAAWLHQETKLAVRDLVTGRSRWTVARITGLAQGLLETIRRRRNQ